MVRRCDGEAMWMLCVMVMACGCGLCGGVCDGDVILVLL